MPKSKKNMRSQRKSSGKSSGKSKRKLNAYFKQMLSAKKQGLSSFSYKNKTYFGQKHPTLGMIYKKQ